MIATAKSDDLELSKYYITTDVTYIDDRTHVLNHCDTFGIFNQSGDILPKGKEVHGLYHKDTRYINKMELRIGGLRPVLMSSNVKGENEILSVDLTNPEMMVEGQLVHHGTIHIRRIQVVRNGLFQEEIEVRNHNIHRQSINLSLEFGSDFKDIFEVRGLTREARGEFQGYVYPSSRSVVISYAGLDGVIRSAEFIFNKEIVVTDGEHGYVHFNVYLNTNEHFNLTYAVYFKEGSVLTTAKDQVDNLVEIDSNIEKSKSYFPSIETSNNWFTQWINQSKADLVSLMADTPYGKYPYAGVPWYNTAFGRDGIITALEVLWAVPDLARDVLLFLAAKQSDLLDEANDAEPGKILHETRGGEMVSLNEVPFKQYYGTIDATPLFVILAGEYYFRTADRITLDKIWPNIVNAINWINEFGDLDKDGFVEYRHKAKNGLTNQGWKDSHDSVFHSNGELAEPPIALCEVQAYVYRAKVLGAKLAKVMGEKTLSDVWKSEAKILKEKFNAIFWDEKIRCYVLALDGHKQPCRVKSSNAGQVLFTGIADASKAAKLVKTLLNPDMFNGWGIRTISSEELRYNPMSYHNGSVWPHDVALIAEGMGEYGYQKQAMQLMGGLFDASMFINLQRLPELFCGMEKRQGEGPTAYPVACSPQAWSVAAVFNLLKAILQIKIQPLKKEVSFNKPVLPSYLKSINIKGLPVDGGYVDFEIIRYGRDNMIGINWNKNLDDWRLSIVK
jgi:glycogen debranching enzyme